VSGVIALTLSPMMCSVFLKSAEEGRFAKIVGKVFGATTRWYGRQLDRSLDYRPITGLFALTILGLVGFLYLHTSKELAPEEDQGIVFSVIKGPKYANIDYLNFYGEKLDKVFSSFPETDLRFALNGINGPQNGIAGMLLKPWDERKRSSIALKPLVQAQLGKIEGVNAFAFNLPPLPGGPGGLPVQMVINSTSGFPAIYEQMTKLKDAARKSRHRQRPRVQPADGAGQDRPLQGERSRHHHADDRQHARDLARRQLCEPLQPRRPFLSSDPSGAARHAAVTGIARRLLPADLDRPAGAAVDRGVDRDRYRPERADPLQPAQLGDLPGGADARRDRRPGGRLPRG
jgi:hypothetical protein